ncbi:DUF4091 domain-containing protein [Bacillus sp. FSL K6-3431]|uniref:DUF4091 domain-containing protein n=1 Tax=Bacillus sp. FSL K6-3431 TaxID=2921500 RepID=UPI0030F59A83
MKNIEFHLVDSLEKVFSTNEPAKLSLKHATLFQNEQFSFQLAYRCNDEAKQKVKIQVRTDDSVKKSLSKVKSVPSDLPAYEDRHDENYLSITPGLFPDLLEPVSEGAIELEINGWNAIWIDIQPDHVANGEKPIMVQVINEEDQILFKETLNIHVIPHQLPEQKLIHTEWFHADCLADYYHVEVFSEEHWRIIENFIRIASENGMNMLLTPVFTPPLDTKVGGERTTVQLVQISLENNEYIFDFTLLKKWLDICKRSNIKYIEIAHLFTQWGAEFTPKIMIMEDGKLIRKFGWDVHADSEDYRVFLHAFLPSLTTFLKENWEQENVYFHISDEPYEDYTETYSKAKEMAEPYLKGFTIIDALSNYSFYEKGIVTKPIVASDHIQPFIDHNVPNLWTYYCCSQNKDVSNRFMAMPSYRNRIIATQLFKYDIEGFLHWGYNFYNSQYSIEPIDPYLVTDAKKGFPSGDPFLVYPGENGEAIPSIRLRVFYQALQDLRAFQWLEELKGKQYVMDIIEKNEKITFTEYPKEGAYIFNIREEINTAIEEALS